MNISGADRELFDRSVSGIAARICDRAVWSEGECTWFVPDNPRNLQPPAAHYSLADGSLYGGSLGIGLFLAEAYGHSGNQRYRETACGAYRHASRQLAKSSPVALFNGLAGLVFVSCRFGQILSDESFVDAARTLIPTIERAVPHDRVLDVIGGSAGAALGILAVRDELGSSLADPVLRRLGDHLLQRAIMLSSGWAWVSTPDSARPLTGLAHGSAGVGLALLELYNAFDDPRYRYGAERAFDHEDSEFDEEAGNWYDLRNSSMYEYGSGAKSADAVHQYKKDVAPWSPRHMMAWCHGAPGIVLSRLRAWRYLRNSRYFSDATAGVKATRADVLSDGSSESICHGSFGNCETLLQAAVEFDEQGIPGEVLDVVRAGCKRVEQTGVPWRSGSWDGVPDISLMKGEAGIGLFLLRLMTPNISNPLFLCGNAHRRPLSSWPGAAVECYEAYLCALFPNSTSEIGSYDWLASDLLKNTQHGPGGNRAIRAQVEDAIMSEIALNPDRAPRLRRAYDLDLACLALQERAVDFAWLTIQRLRSSEGLAQLLDDTWVSLASSVHLWTLSADPMSKGDRRDMSDEHVLSESRLLVRTRSGVETLSPTRLATLLLSAANAGGHRWADIRERVLTQLDLPPNELIEVKERLVRQLASAVGAGYLLLDQSGGGVGLPVG